MNIESLGYIGVTTTDLDAWRRFGGEMLGMQVVERGSSLAFRLDERCQRILVDHGSSNGGSYYGFQVADELALNAAARELEARGVCVSVPDAEELRRRGVAAMCYFLDPCGNRLELFHGHAAADDPFRPSRPLRGFRTGELGLGHVVFNVPSIADVLPFYTDVLGFRVSDYAEEPFKATFLHANARHHSVALIESTKSGLHHMMVELLSLDDVGQAYDRVNKEEGLVGATLGRHTNDYMVSFYAWSPSRFLVEYGWGGRTIDEATWRIERLQHGPSLWGHERTWLPEPLRAKALEMRLRAAMEGVKAPLQVAAGTVRFYAVEPTPEAGGTTSGNAHQADGISQG